MARYPRHAPARPPFLIVLLNYLSYLVLFAVCSTTLFLAWPLIQARIATAPPANAPAPISAPTLRPAGQSDRSAPQALPEIAPTASLAQIEATSMAVYQATVQAVNAAPIPNVDNTNDTAPLIREQISVDRQPPGANVPTAEPLLDTQANDQFGSKPVIVNPQADHVCRHAQVWTDAGCKNPTPLGSQP